jgi:hypothetical protein
MSREAVGVDSPCDLFRSGWRFEMAGQPPIVPWLLGLEQVREFGCDGGPGEVVAVGGAAAGRELGLEVGVGEDLDQGVAELGGLVWGNQNYAGVGYRGGGFRAGEGDYREAAGDCGDGAAAARRDGTADEEQNVAGAEVLHDSGGIDDAFDGEVNGKVAKAFAERGFAKLGVAAENGEMQATEFRGGVADSGKDEFRFASAGGATGDAEDADGRD